MLKATAMTTLSLLLFAGGCTGAHEARVADDGNGSVIGTGGARSAGSAGGTGASAGASASPSLAGCPLFPADNVWNQDISGEPADPMSSTYVANINEHGYTTIRADFGSDSQYGIPWTTVGANQPKVPMDFDFADESDPGPYPIPADAPIEGGSDHHIIVLDTSTCLLYETWDSTYVGPGWHCGSGAVFDVRSNAQRPDGFTSGDAAGLPILPGLVRYEEVAAGEIPHALRFTVARTQRAYVDPATHYASSITDPSYPPLGLRFRLKADYDISGFHGSALVILKALKKYGMFLADNGQNWFVSGTSDPRFDDSDLQQLRSIPGTAFEVVKPGPIHR